MEAKPTAEPCKKKAAPRYTARASLGRQCEDQALSFYLALGYRLYRRNFRWHRLEGDLLFRHPSEDHFLLVEVRGRHTRRHAPGELLTGKKRQALRRLAEGLIAHRIRPLRVELMEIVEEKVARFRVF